MKKTFAFVAMLCMAAMFSSLATAASGPVQCQYFPGTTFTIDGDISEWPAGSLILSGITVADKVDPPAGISWPDPNPLYSVDIYTAWDADYLYIAYDVTDPDSGLKTEDHPSFVGNRFVKDMLRVYFEMDNDDTLEIGADSGEFTWDIMASQSNDGYNVSHMTVNTSTAVASAFGVDSANYANSANGTLIANASSDGAGQYIVEARLSWLDLSARLTTASMPFTMPVSNTVWGYDFLFIDDTPIQDHVDNTAGYAGGGQFTLHSLHDTAAWSDMTFVGDPSQGEPPATAGVPLIHDGLYAAKITRNAAGVDSGFDINDAKVDVTGITTLNISWWMRSGSEADATIAAIGVASFDSAQAHLPGYGEPNLVDGDNVVGTDWEFRSADFTVPGADVNFINLGIRLAVGSSLVVDDVKIVDTANPGVNLVANGSFEDWGNGVIYADVDTTVVAENGGPDSWRFFGVGGANATIERVGSSVVTNVQEGSYSAKVTNDTAPAGQIFLDRDFPGGHFPVESSTDYMLSFWMRSGSSAPATVAGQVQPFGGDPVGYKPPAVNVFAALFATPIPVTWTYYSTIYTSAADVTEVSIRLDPATGSSFVIDDLQFVKVSSGENIIPNGDFEAWGAGVTHGPVVIPNGVPDTWRLADTGDTGGKIERLEFQPAAPNAVRVDWTWMQ